jgi:hypothetical protein
VIEFRRDVQDKSVVYVKKHGQRPEMKRIQPHWATPRIEVEVCLTQAAAWDRNLQPYGATPGTEVLLWRWEKRLPLRKLVLPLPHLQIIPKSSDSS